MLRQYAAAGNTSDVFYTSCYSTVLELQVRSYVFYSTLKKTITIISSRSDTNTAISFLQHPGSTIHFAQNLVRWINSVNK